MSLKLSGKPGAIHNRLLVPVLRLFMGRMIDGRQAELDMLTASGLAWPALGPLRLTNGKGKGGWTFDQDRPSAAYITREDLALAVVATLTRDDLIRQAPFVSAAELNYGQTFAPISLPSAIG